MHMTISQKLSNAVKFYIKKFSAWGIGMTILDLWPSKNIVVFSIFKATDSCQKALTEKKIMRPLDLGLNMFMTHFAFYFFFVFCFGRGRYFSLKPLFFLLTVPR